MSRVSGRHITRHNHLRAGVTLTPPPVRGNSGRCLAQNPAPLQHRESVETRLNLNLGALEVCTWVVRRGAPPSRVLVIGVEF